MTNLDLLDTRLSGICETLKERRAQLSSETLLKVATMSVAMMIVDLAKRTIVQTTPSADELFGYSVDELLGKDVQTLVPEDKREKHLAGIAEYSQNPVHRQLGKRYIDLYGLKKDGSLVRVLVDLLPFVHDDVQYVRVLMFEGGEGG